MSNRQSALLVPRRRRFGAPRSLSTAGCQEWEFGQALDAHGHRDCLWAVIKNESLIASLKSSIHPPTYGNNNRPIALRRCCSGGRRGTHNKTLRTTAFASEVPLLDVLCGHHLSPSYAVGVPRQISSTASRGTRPRRSNRCVG